MGVFKHPLLFGLVVAEIIERERAGSVVDVGQCLFQVAIRHDRQERTEDFLLHHLHLVVDLQQQAMGHASALALLIQRDQACAFGAGIGFQMLQARQLPLVDDGCVVRVIAQRRIKTVHHLTIRINKSADPVFRHQHVIRGDTGLSRIQAFAPGDALGGVLERYVGRDNGRGFAPQFQRDRRQVFGRRTHHQLAHMGRAGEQQVVHWQRRKSHCDLGIAQHHGDHVIGENPPQQVFEQTPGGRGEFTEFEHHPVARRQRTDQGAHRQKQRVIPRNYDPDHAQRLIQDAGAGGLEHYAYAAGRGFHPAFKVFKGVIDVVQAGHQFGKQRFVRATVAKVLADGVD